MIWYCPYFLFRVQRQRQSLGPASIIFVRPFFSERSSTFHFSRFSFFYILSPPPPPPPLLSSLCPGSHYCFGKYFIGLNTSAHSHLPVFSPLWDTHRPRIDRSKWERARDTERVLKWRFPACPSYFWMQCWVDFLSLLWLLLNRVLLREENPRMLSNLCPTTFCFLKIFFPQVFFSPSHERQGGETVVL